MATDRDMRGGVSVNLATNYITSVKGNQPVYIHVVVSKIGRNLAFTSATFYSESGEVLANGQHTKFLISSKM